MELMSHDVRARHPCLTLILRVIKAQKVFLTILITDVDFLGVYIHLDRRDLRFGVKNCDIARRVVGPIMLILTCKKQSALTLYTQLRCASVYVMCTVTYTNVHDVYSG